MHSKIIIIAGNLLDSHALETVRSVVTVPRPDMEQLRIPFNKTNVGELVSARAIVSPRKPQCFSVYVRPKHEQKTFLTHT